MKAYLRTRGRRRPDDYRFLGSTDPEPWWRAYADRTQFEYPTILVVSDDSGWRAWLSGIPSARLDAVGTTIRYSLDLEGTAGEGGGEADVLRLVEAWLGDLGDLADSRLQAALDRRFPTDVVEVLYRSPDESDASVGALIAEVAADLATPDDADTEPTAAEAASEHWIGSADGAGARAAFAARVGELLHGGRGRALLFNLSLTEQEARDVVAGGEGPTAILVDGPSWAHETEPVPIRPPVPPEPEKKKRPVPPEPTKVLLRIALACGAILLAAVIVVWEAWRSHRPR
jgi:hypothetical protein